MQWVLRIVVLRWYNGMREQISHSHISTLFLVRCQMVPFIYLLNSTIWEPHTNSILPYSWVFLTCAIWCITEWNRWQARTSDFPLLPSATMNLNERRGAGTHRPPATNERVLTVSSCEYPWTCCGVHEMLRCDRGVCLSQTSWPFSVIHRISPRISFFFNPLNNAFKVFLIQVDGWGVFVCKPTHSSSCLPQRNWVDLNNGC